MLRETKKKNERNLKLISLVDRRIEKRERRHKRWSDKVPAWIQNGMFVFAFVTIILNYFQFQDLRKQIDQNSLQSSANFMLSFAQQLRNEFSTLRYDFEFSNPIFNKHKHSVEEVEKYIGMWELLDSLYEKNIILHDQVYNAFGDDIVKTWDNDEIKKYILDMRQKDSNPNYDWYGGFEHLASEMKKIDRGTHD